MLARVIRPASQGDLDRRGIQLADHAVITVVAPAGAGREGNRAADIQTRPGQRGAAGLGELEKHVPAQARVFVHQRQIHQARAGPLGLGGREPGGKPGGLARFGLTLQIKQPSKPGEMVFFATGAIRRIVNPYADAPPG